MTEQGSSFFSSHDPAQYSRAECALSRWTVLFAAIAIGLMIGGVHCLWTGAQIREASAFNTRTAQNYF
jgi:hypothetical protein